MRGLARTFPAETSVLSSWSGRSLHANMLPEGAITVLWPLRPTLSHSPITVLLPLAGQRRGEVPRSVAADIASAQTASGLLSEAMTDRAGAINRCSTKAVRWQWHIRRVCSTSEVPRTRTS